jgi:hypothetical protein
VGGNIHFRVNVHQDVHSRVGFDFGISVVIGDICNSDPQRSTHHPQDSHADVCNSGEPPIVAAAVQPHDIHSTAVGSSVGAHETSISCTNRSSICMR